MTASTACRCHSCSEDAFLTSISYWTISLLLERAIIGISELLGVPRNLLSTSWMFSLHTTSKLSCQHWQLLWYVNLSCRADSYVHSWIISDGSSLPRIRTRIVLKTSLKAETGLSRGPQVWTGHMTFATSFDGLRTLPVVERCQRSIALALQVMRLANCVPAVEFRSIDHLQQRITRSKQLD